MKTKKFSLGLIILLICDLALIIDLVVVKSLLGHNLLISNIVRRLVGTETYINPKDWLWELAILIAAILYQCSFYWWKHRQNRKIAKTPAPETAG